MSNKTTDWKKHFINEGFHNVAWVPISPSLTLDKYKQWLAEGLNAGMSYLERHIQEKENPELLLKDVQGAFVLTYNYYPHPEPQNKSQLKIAKYARGEDYHFWLNKKIENVLKKIREESGGNYLSFTDSRPILERDLAYRAGLGWIGKNTCLIEQNTGSFFFIAGALTDQIFKDKIEIHPNRCGTCTACLDACPTNALVEPYKLDARKCISYWTIEAKKSPSPDLAKSFDGWHFGCDICQDVCPWNQKAFGKEIHNVESEKSELAWILRASNSKLIHHFKSTPLNRTSPYGHRRNAIIAIANKNYVELKDLVEKHSESEKLRDLVSWALSSLR